jgi:hypothetical protein
VGECAGYVGRAANDLTLIFRKAAQELSSAFTVWALRLTERCVNILLADVLLPYAAPLGLSTMMECVLQMVVYCSCLEDTHRVCLQPHMLRVLWPHVEKVVTDHVARYVVHARKPPRFSALEMRFHKDTRFPHSLVQRVASLLTFVNQGCFCSASERVRMAAMRDVSDMVSMRRSTFPAGGSPPCGNVLVSEITSLVEEMLCMDAIEVGKSMRNATESLFRSMCEGVERGVQHAIQQNRGALPQIIISNGEGIMMGLSYVMETLLPKATAGFASKLGVLCVSRKLEPALHNVAHALGVEAVQDDV